MTLAEAASGLQERLRQAVAWRLVSEVPICAYLSGGIDSTMVLGLATESKRIPSFNISFAKTEYDEYDGAKRTAEYYRSPFQSIDCSAAVLASHVEEALYHTEMSCPNAGFVGKFLLSQRLQEEGFKVALTGEGADKIFAGYPFFKLEALWRHELFLGSAASTNIELNVLKKTFRSMEKRSEGLLWNDTEEWRYMTPLLGFHSASYLRALIYSKFQKYLLNFNIPLLRRLNPAQIFEDDCWQPLTSLHPLQASMVQNYRHLSNWIFPCLGDRLELAHAVEGRTPFLDNDVVDFVSTIPPEFLLDVETLREKKVLYEAAKGIIPDDVAQRHKHPFFAPSWFEIQATQPGKKLFAKHVSISALRRAQIFSVLAVIALYYAWYFIPKSTVLHRKLDAAMGVVLTVQILDAHFNH